MFVLKTPQVGDRVRVSSTHRWMRGKAGVIKEIETRTGNSIIVKFDQDLLGMYHDGDGDPVLRLCEIDLEKIIE